MLPRAPTCHYSTTVRALWTGLTTLVHDDEGGVRHETGGDIGRQLGPGCLVRQMRYRELDLQDLDRARVEVAAWRAENPEGTREELVAAAGPGFPSDYGIVLRGVLVAVDRDRVALASLETAWAGSGYCGFSADDGTWSAISSNGEILTGATAEELGEKIRTHWQAMQ
jgi:hypothetical protein